MATIKTTSSDYTINVGPYDTGNSSWIGTMTVNGNLTVTGNVTTIHTTDLKIDDPFITVAANNNGATTSMGMIAQKTTTTFAGLRFNTITNEWEISSSVSANGSPVSSYTAISTGSSSPGGPENAVQLNVGGAFSGSANLLFNKASYGLQANSQVTLANIASTPTATSNSASLYNKAQGVGGTGVYVVSSTADDELISLTRARLYAIIF